VILTGCQKSILTAFSALMLFIGQQEWHPVHKKRLLQKPLGWWTNG